MDYLRLIHRYLQIIHGQSTDINISLFLFLREGGRHVMCPQPPLPACRMSCRRMKNSFYSKDVCFNPIILDLSRQPEIQPWCFGLVIISGKEKAKAPCQNAIAMFGQTYREVLRINHIVGKH